MNNFGQQILTEIKEHNIQPKKRWEFLFKNIILWVILISAIFLASLASSVTIFMLKHAVGSTYIPDFHPLKRLLLDLPFFWLVSLALFSLLAWYDFKNTKRGYKYHTWVIVIGSLLVSIVLGAVIYQAGVGERLEDVFFRRVPFYKEMFRRGGRILVEPDKGHLAGVVRSVASDAITVEDFKGDVWVINTSTSQFRVGQRVMLIGKIGDDDRFVCESIKPWLKPQGHVAPPPMFPRP
ncbi:MAG: hypothetical protein WC465_02325 [Patescibacteria group bacterium]